MSLTERVQLSLIYLHLSKGEKEVHLEVCTSELSINSQLLFLFDNNIKRFFLLLSALLFMTGFLSSPVIM